MKKIVAISGSLRQGSSNHAILRYLGSCVTESACYIIYDGIANVPAFDPDLDNDTPPKQIVTLRKLLTDADGIIICTPEYAFGVPGSLKNVLDWLVSSSTLVDKPVVLITASLGGEYAHSSLLLTLGALSAKMSNKTNLLIQFVRSKIDAVGNITDKQVLRDLQIVLEAFLSDLQS